MNKRRAIRGLWALTLLSLVFLARDAAAQTATWTGDAATQTYGGTACNQNVNITLNWTITFSSGSFVPAKDAKMTVYLGEALDARVELYSSTRQITADTTGTGNGTLQDGISGTLQQISKSSAKGMFTQPKSLTIRDLIGYYKVALEGGQPPASSDAVCTLEAPANENAKQVKICVVVEYQGLENNQEKTLTSNAMCQPVKFDLTPPLAPADIKVAPSEKQIVVSWSVSEQKDHTYDIFVSTQSFNSSTQGQIVPTPHNGSSPVSASSYTAKALKEQTKYYVAIRAIDEAGNAGAISAVKETSTVELTDFYEAYRKAGGKDKGFEGGGYCFIATAAYGTYDHRYVQILRDFRDQYLLTHKPGKAFVAWYYRTSPSWASWIRSRPKTRRVVQAALLPLIAAAAFLVRLSLFAKVLCVLALLLFFLGWRLRKRWLQALPLALALLVWSPSSWAATPRNFGLEVRAGIYQPQIDQETGLNQGQSPYKSIFGDPLQLYLELNGEWLVFKGFGSVGIGGSFGFTWAQAKASSSQGTSSTDDTDSTNNTGLWIIPLRLDVVYRMDYLTQRYGFPLVPYVRTGMDYYIWFVTNPSGGIAEDSTSQEANAAFGGRLGFHFGLGIQFLLDVLDRNAARTFDNEMGVNHTYLFFEWNFAWVGVLTPGLNLSDSSFRAGLLFQF